MLGEKKFVYGSESVRASTMCVCVPEIVLALRLVLFPMFYLLDMLSTFPIQQKKVNPFHEITNVSNLCWYWQARWFSYCSCVFNYRESYCPVILLPVKYLHEITACVFAPWKYHVLFWHCVVGQREGFVTFMFLFWTLCEGFSVPAVPKASVTVAVPLVALSSCIHLVDEFVTATAEEQVGECDGHRLPGLSAEAGEHAAHLAPPGRAARRPPGSEWVIAGTRSMHHQLKPMYSWGVTLILTDLPMDGTSIPWLADQPTYNSWRLISTPSSSCGLSLNFSDDNALSWDAIRFQTKPNLGALLTNKLR